MTTSGSGKNSSSDVAERRAKMLSFLGAQPVCGRAEARAAAAALHMSERQVYRLLQRLRTARTGFALPEKGALGRKGGKRLSAAIQLQFDRIIQEEGSAQTGGGRSALFRAVRDRCQREMSPAPSIRTIFRRLRQRQQTLAALKSCVGEPAQAPPILRGGPQDVSTESLLLPLYKTIGNPTGWRGFLDALSHAYGGSLTTLISHDYANRGSVDYAATAGVEKDFEMSYIRHYARLNPWLDAGEQRPIGVAALSDSVVPYADLLRTEFYNDWCRPQRIGGGVASTVERNGRRVLTVTVLTSRSIIDQDPALLSRLERLTPHLLWVSQLHRQFTTLEARASAAEGAIDRLATAMLVLNAAGQIIYTNPLAERIVATRDGLNIRQGRLEAASSIENELLWRVINAASAALPTLVSQPGGVVGISRPSGRQSFEVLVAPIFDATIRLGVRGSLVAVFIREPEARYKSPAVLLKQLYGLTAAESRLMQALLVGDTLDEAAARFAVTRETVRTQLKAIFQKTGTSSQSALLRLGLRSLAARYS